MKLHAFTVPVHPTFINVKSSAPSDSLSNPRNTNFVSAGSYCGFPGRSIGDCAVPPQRGQCSAQWSGPAPSGKGKGNICPRKMIQINRYTRTIKQNAPKARPPATGKPNASFFLSLFQVNVKR